MSRHSHEIFDNKASKRGLLGWLTGEPERSSVNGSVGSPALLQPATSLKTSEATPARSPVTSPATSPVSSPAGPPENTPANGSDGFPPLSVVRIGNTVRIDRSLDEKVEWSNEDFACWFLLWLATEFPACQNCGWVSVPDIDDEFFVRFQEDAGCPYLEL